jgi:hypothetical protein
MVTNHAVPAASRGAARRHRVEGGRPHAVKVRFTDDEYAALSARAAASRVSIQRFLVEGALTPRRQVVVPAALNAELAGLHRLVANLANNINQIARKLNAGGRPDASVTAATNAVARAMTRLDTALAWLGEPPRQAPHREPPASGQPGSQSARGSPPRLAASHHRSGP